MQLNLGTKIRDLRRHDGRTQEALADALGVTSQAVSRWESGGSYPDMEIIPSIANYFGVSIDELFGYNNDRSVKIDKIVSDINAMNLQNNGVDINIDECIMLAREAMVEFPANEKIMLCLASVLYNAGYVRYGEYHLIDGDGYSIYDAERHRGYDEWKEAIKLYEKLLETLGGGELRQRAVGELTQLYLNIGEHEKALAITETAPNIYGSRELLKINACDGKMQAQAYGEALLKTVRVSAELTIGTVIAYGQNMTPAEKAESIRGAIKLFDCICSNGNYGTHASYISRMYILLSLYLWLDGKHDEAFEALDDALTFYMAFEKVDYNADYTSPLLRLVKMEQLQVTGADVEHPHVGAESLADDWPWWCVPEYSLVKDEMWSDPRWEDWVKRTRK